MRHHERELLRNCNRAFVGTTNWDAEPASIVCNGAAIIPLHEWFPSKEGILIDTTTSVLHGVVAREHTLRDLVGSTHMALRSSQLSMMPTRMEILKVKSSRINLARWIDVNSKGVLDADGKFYASVKRMREQYHPRKAMRSQ